MTNHTKEQVDRRRLAFEHLQNNKPREALKLAKTMCEETPLDTESWMLQAASHAALGSMSEVAHCCEQTLAIDPGHIQARHNLGIALGNISTALSKNGDHEESLFYLEKLLSLQPENTDAHAAIGRAYLAINNPQQALTHLYHAERMQNNRANHSFAIGRCLENLDNLPEAEKAYKDTIRKDPLVFEAYNNLAGILQTSGRLGEALEFYDQAITLKPTVPELHYNKCLCLYFNGQAKDALSYGLRAFNLTPEKLEIRQALAQAFSGYHGKADPLWEQSLVELFTDSRLDFQLLHGVANELVLQRLNTLIPEFTELSAPQLTQALVEHTISGKITEATDQPLFSSLLTETVCCTTTMEIFLTALRAAVLHIATTPALQLDKSFYGNMLSSVCALACQCGATEYIYNMDDAEQENLNTLLESTANHLHPQLPVDIALQFRLAMIACYRPLHTIYGILALTNNRDKTESCFNRVFERQLLNHLQEQELKGHIDTLTSITDTTSELVREQYEDFPYPRWLSFSKLKPRPPQKIIGELFPWLKSPSFPTGSMRILIAGCGTGRHALITANRFRNCELLAVDLSASSLAYAIRMAKYYDIDNIQFAQADILKLDSTDQTFHIIESVGVLHHMREPVEGLKVLANLLEPDGLMNIGLYSKAGRHHILAAQKLFRKQGGTGVMDIRAGRRTIKDLGNTHPAHDVIHMQDFYSASECRDLLLHVQERCYDLAEIEAMLIENGLEFIGFEFRDPTGKLKFQSINDAPQDLGNLQKWKLFEQNNPDTFLEMYVFWCKRIR